MSAPYSNLRSKLNRAIAAYLVNSYAGTASDVLPGDFVGAKTYPNTTIESVRGLADPYLSGNYRVTVHVTIRSSATNQFGELNPDVARKNHDRRVALTCDALMQSSDGYSLTLTASLINSAGRGLATPYDGSPQAAQLASNNADMVDFTIVQWIDQGFGIGEPDSEGCAFVEVLIFEALACAKNVD